jgi:hypothetical protein
VRLEDVPGSTAIPRKLVKASSTFSFVQAAPPLT